MAIAHDVIKRVYATVKLVIHDRLWLFFYEQDKTNSSLQIYARCMEKRFNHIALYSVYVYV